MGLLWVPQVFFLAVGEWKYFASLHDRHRKARKKKPLTPRTKGAITANYSYLYLKLNAFVAYSAGVRFNSDKHTE